MFCHPGFKESLLSALSRLVTPGMDGDKGEVHVNLAVYRVGNGHRETHHGLRSAVSSKDNKHITISFAFFFPPHGRNLNICFPHSYYGNSVAIQYMQIRP